MMLKHWKQKCATLLVLSCMLLVVACTAVPVPVSVPAETQLPASVIPEVSVQVTGDALTLPEEVPAGVVSFVVTPPEEAQGTLQIVRIHDDATVDEFLEAMAADPESALPMVSRYGDPWSTNGPLDAEVVYDLPVGNYAAVLASEQGPLLIGTFTTKEESEVPPPAAEITVDMTDFAFLMPDTVPAGRHTWQIKNTGNQWHEMAIAQLNAGATIEDVIAWVESGMEGMPPGQIIAGWSPMGAGRTAWVTWEIPPGNYTVICIVPDLEGDMAPHLAKGMVHSLTVAE